MCWLPRSPTKLSFIDFTGTPLHRLDSVDRKNVLEPHKPHLQRGDDVQSEEWTLGQHHLCKYWVKNVQSLTLWFNFLIYLSIAKLWGKGNHRTITHHKALGIATQTLPSKLAKHLGPLQWVLLAGKKSSDLEPTEEGLVIRVRIDSGWRTQSSSHWGTKLSIWA